MKEKTLPEGWNESTLLEVVKPKYSKFFDGDWILTEDLNSGNDVRLIQLADIGEGIFLDNTSKFISCQRANKLGCQFLNDGDILVSRMAEPIARSCILPKLYMPYITAVDICVIKVNEKLFDKRYINFLFNSNIIRSKATSLSSGTTRKRISRRNLEKINVNFPPIQEQQKIADILTSIDETIDETEHIIKVCERIKRGFMQTLLVKGLPGKHTKFKTTKIGEVPYEWEIKRLNEFCDVIDCKHRTPKYYDVGIPVIRPRDIQAGKLSFEDTLKTSYEEYLDLTEKYRPKKGDIVYSRNASFGVASYVATDECFTIGQDVVIITSRKMSNHYLFYLLNSDIIKSQIKKNSAGSTFQRINLKDIRNLLIPYLEYPEQEKISQILSSFDNRIESEKQKKSQLEIMKKGLMQKLLTGEVRVKVN